MAEVNQYSARNRFFEKLQLYGQTPGMIDAHDRVRRRSVLSTQIMRYQESHFQLSEFQQPQQVFEPQPPQQYYTQIPVNSQQIIPQNPAPQFDLEKQRQQFQALQQQQRLPCAIPPPPSRNATERELELLRALEDKYRPSVTYESGQSPAERLIVNSQLPLRSVAQTLQQSCLLARAPVQSIGQVAKQPAPQLERSATRASSMSLRSAACAPVIPAIPPALAAQQFFENQGMRYSIGYLEDQKEDQSAQLYHLQQQAQEFAAQKAELDRANAQVAKKFAGVQADLRRILNQ